MAGKNGSGTSWVPAQGDALIEAVNTAYNTFNSKYEEIKSIFTQIRGEEVIGDSTSKDKLIEVMDGVDATFNILNEKLANVKTTLSQVFEAVSAASDTNESATADAAATVQATAKRAEETNGSGAK